MNMNKPKLIKQISPLHKNRLDWVVNNQGQSLKLFDEYRNHGDAEFLYDCIDDAIEQEQLNNNSYWNGVNQRVSKELEGFEKAFALRDQMKINERNERIARKKTNKDM